MFLSIELADGKKDCFLTLDDSGVQHYVGVLMIAEYPQRWTHTNFWLVVFTRFGTNLLSAMNKVVSEEPITTLILGVLPTYL